MTVRMNLYKLRKMLELMHEQNYTWEDIAQGTGLHPNTIYNLAANRRAGVKFRTLAVLLSYFREKGLEVSISDLLVEDPVVT